MKTKHLPRKGGIYEIRNLANGKLYVGSAVDLQKRLLEHRRTLRLNFHRNRKLQNAFNKYGEKFFEVKVLELVEQTEQLLEREQFWLDVTQAVKNGYNILEKAGSNLGLKWSEESCELSSRIRRKIHKGFISPEGEKVVIKNMIAFCREHNLQHGTMYGLATGKQTSHKGWTHENSRKLKRKWISTYEGFINPSDEKVPPITNLEKFARENGLNAKALNRVFHGRTRSYKGWTHEITASKPFNERKGKLYKGFVNPQGKSAVIENLAKFCRENNLDQATMWRVIKGKEKQHKGWTYQSEKEG